MEVVVTTGAISRAKLQPNRHTNKPTPSFFTGRMLFLSPNQQCQSTEWKISHSMDFHGVFQLCLWPLTAPGCLAGGLPCLSRKISGILLQTTSSACWKRFCSQRTSAISALDVSRRCALQIYILLTYLSALWPPLHMYQKRCSHLLIAVPQMLQVGKSNMRFGSWDDLCLTSGWISSHQHHQGPFRQSLQHQR